MPTDMHSHTARKLDYISYRSDASHRHQSAITEHVAKGVGQGGFWGRPIYADGPLPSSKGRISGLRRGDKVRIMIASLSILPNTNPEVSMVTFFSLN